ncbi:YmfL family putative regulatory protein [Yersinia mollaretii]|uniref:YmfL family putative regulatory protein n=1 Tax=Yersinia mollaretii TaxID=33060 RepID=UPI00119DED1F|nr:YmfL family putative regulatory protein [Yersinia mollaretii]
MDNKDFPTQPDITDAIHKLITSTTGGYEGMAQQLAHNGTDHALRNRVRQHHGQVVPLGMAVLMESISGRTDITEAMCKRVNAVMVKLPNIDQIHDEELHERFLMFGAKYGELHHKFIEYTADGELDHIEEAKFDQCVDELIQVIQGIKHLAKVVYKRRPPPCADST